MDSYVIVCFRMPQPAGAGQATVAIVNSSSSSSSIIIISSSTNSSSNTTNSKHDNTSNEFV